MKQLALILAIVIGLMANHAVANNTQPNNGKQVEITHNGCDFVKVAVAKEAGVEFNVKFFNQNFELLYQEEIKGVSDKQFDISQLVCGFYFVKVEKNKKTIYTEVIEKTETPLVANYR